MPQAAIHFFATAPRCLPRGIALAYTSAQLSQLIPSLVAIFFLLFMVGVVFVGLQNRPPPKIANLESADSAPVTRLMGVAMIFAFGALAAYGFWSLAWQEHAVSAFVPVDAKILSSRVLISRGGRHNSFAAIVVYTYVFNGSTYKNRRILPFDDGMTREWAEDIVSRFPAGATSTAYIDPDDPDASVLVRLRSALPYVAAIVGCLLSIVGMYLLLGWLKNWRTEMQAVPVEKGFLLLPAQKLRQSSRNWGLMLIAYTLIVVPLWIHCLMVIENLSTTLQLVTVLFALGLAGLLIKWWRSWMTARHVSDARLVVRPVPMKIGELFEFSVEFDAYAPLQIDSLQVQVCCSENYQDRTDRKMTTSSRTFIEKTLDLVVPSEVRPGAIVSASGTVQFPGRSPATGKISKNDYPNYVWYVKVILALKNTPSYQSYFPLLVENPQDVASPEMPALAS